MRAAVGEHLGGQQVDELVDLGAVLWVVAVAILGPLEAGGEEGAGQLLDHLDELPEHSTADLPSDGSLRGEPRRHGGVDPAPARPHSTRKGCMEPYVLAGFHRPLGCVHDPLDVQVVIGVEVWKSDSEAAAAHAKPLSHEVGVLLATPLDQERVLRPDSWHRHGGADLVCLQHIRLHDLLDL